MIFCPAWVIYLGGPFSSDTYVYCGSINLSRTFPRIGAEKVATQICISSTNPRITFKRSYLLVSMALFFSLFLLVGSSGNWGLSYEGGLFCSLVYKGINWCFLEKVDSIGLLRSTRHILTVWPGERPARWGYNTILTGPVSREAKLINKHVNIWAWIG